MQKRRKRHKSVCILQKVILFSGIRERCNWGNDVATIHGFFLPLLNKDIPEGCPSGTSDFVGAMSNAR